MPSDLTVSRVGAAAPAAGERAMPTAHDGPGPGMRKPAPDAHHALPNPTLRLDPGLAMVVIEFRDDSGNVRNSIPSQHQLDAYRAWDRTHAAASAAAPGAGGLGEAGGSRGAPDGSVKPGEANAAPRDAAAVNGAETKQG